MLKEIVIEIYLKSSFFRDGIQPTPNTHVFWTELRDLLNKLASSIIWDFYQQLYLGHFEMPCFFFTSNISSDFGMFVNRIFSSLLIRQF